ncbi:MAG: hypothetical protein ACK4K2_00845 [Dehalococcoidia bacterium]
MHNGTRAWKPLRRWTFPAVLVAVLGWLLVPAIASGWIEWDDVDPLISLRGGHILSVRVEWPRPFTCSIQGPILVEVQAPKGLKALVVEESSGDFPCQTLTTHTTVSEKRGGGKEVEVRVLVRSNTDFPVRVPISLDGSLVTAPEGTSNSWVEGEVTVR